MKSSCCRSRYNRANSSVDNLYPFGVYIILPQIRRLTFFGPGYSAPKMGFRGFDQGFTGFTGVCGRPELGLLGCIRYHKVWFRGFL